MSSEARCVGSIGFIDVITLFVTYCTSEDCFSLLFTMIVGGDHSKVIQSYMKDPCRKESSVLQQKSVTFAFGRLKILWSVEIVIKFEVELARFIQF
jgi:hypothetical protein